MIKEKIKHIYYTFHPNFVHDDTEPRGYRVIDGGKWVVEWNIYTPPMTLQREPTHYKKAFKTEESAKVFYNKLMRRYEKQERKRMEKLG